MVIHDINIDAQPGQTIALLGPVGSGKTTVLNLLPRFYDVTERPHHHRRHGHPRRDARVAARQRRHRHAGRLPVQRHDPRQHRLRPARRHRRRDHRGGEDRPPARLHHDPAGRLRHLGRRARHHALGRPEAARLHRPHPAAGPQDPRPGRLHLQRGHGDRVPDPAGAGRPAARAAPPSSSPTGCARCATPTRSSCSRTATSSSRARTTSCSRSAASTARSTTCSCATRKTWPAERTTLSRRRRERQL